MNRKAWLLTAFLAVWGTGYLLGRYPPVHLGEVLFFGLLTFALSLMRVPLPLVGQVTMGFVGALAASVSLFPNWAFVVGALGYFNPRPVWYKELFNRLQLGVSAGTASYLYTSFYPSLWAFPMAALGYFLVNTLGLLLLFWTMGMEPKVLWRRQYRSFALAYVGLVPLAFLMAELYRHPVMGWGGFAVLALVLPVFFVWRMWDYQVRLLQTVNTVVYSLVNLLEARDPYTAHHSQRVAAIALDIGREMGLPPEDLELLERAAKLHDLGKVAVPDAVLNKRGGLTPQEWHTMRSHPEVGYTLLKPLLSHLGNIGPGILHHHERFDGRGYPKGLAGQEIPLMARIIAVADAYEAMTSDRPYRRGKSPEEALREIQDLSGIQFDRDVVQAFTRAWEKNPSWRHKGRFVTTLV